MNKRLTAAILAASIGLSAFAGCSKTAESSSEASSAVSSAASTSASEFIKTPASVVKEIGDVSSEQEKAFRQGYLNFSFELLKKNLEQDGNSSNVMVSPASVMLALDMTAAGSADNTLLEMMALYGGDKDPQGQLSYAAKILNRLNDSKGVSMHAADSIWVNSDVMPEGLATDYKDFVKDYFDAQAESLVFDKAAEDKINGWVKDNTDGMIPGIVDELDPTMAMMLINAIAFDGKWAKQYEDYQVEEDTFQAASGDKQTAQMMSGSESVYLENDLATGFAKYYDGGQYAFVVMLPKDETQNAGDMLAGFTGDSFDQYMNSASKSYIVRTKMPEFSYDWGRSIVPQLQAMGMKVPFVGGMADFSGITGSHNGLFIGDVIHKTHIEVNRRGTRAAAVTAVEMFKNSVAVDDRDVKEVICDRPFAYAIVDMTDNTPVFIGTVNSI